MTEAQAAKKFPLLAPALQGLTRYAHLISVEYFSDLLTVMQQIGKRPPACRCAPGCSAS